MNEPRTNPTLAELVAALPPELVEPASREAELAELFALLSRKSVPTGRVLRMWSFGTLQARVAAAYLAYWIRSRFANDETRTRLRKEAHLRAALRLLGGMGYLRGALMKAGQMLASYPHLVPEEFVGTLEALHFQAPPMHFSLLREHVYRELGGDPEELFAEFETDAFAAASLGQVHRARLRGGERVAVKIQYPNIARTIDSDFRNGRALCQPLRFFADWDEFMACGEEIHRMLLLEADYENELANAERVRAVLEDMDDVVVPRTYPELSSKRVLTMEYLSGLHPGEFVRRRPPAELRDHHGAQILRTCARLMNAGLLHSDTNSGNYLMLPDGRLGMLDFGNVRAITDDEWGLMTSGIRGFREGGEALREAIRRCGLLTDEELADEERYALTEATCEWLWEPMRHEGPFDFGDEAYLRRGLEIMTELVRRGYTKTHPMLTWLNRTLYGVRALAFQLRARVDLARIYEEELARAGL